MAQKAHKPTKFVLPHLRFIHPLRLFSKACTSVLAALWTWAPVALRIATYRSLASLGKYLYGRSCSLYVQRLPFGLYLKTGTRKNYGSLKNVYRALELVRQHADIVVPRPLDLLPHGTESYLLTSAVPGCHVGLCIQTMSDGEVAVLVHDLRAWLVQLRSISRTQPQDCEITNAAGKGCYYLRISAGTEYDEARGDFFGPFKDENAFIDFLRCDALPDVVHRGGHKIVFTHGYVNMRNILVKDGKLSGIVDWECAGWYPEYWDYTKAHFVTKHHHRWKKIVDRVFAELGDYREELATEEKLWDYCFG